MGTFLNKKVLLGSSITEWITTLLIIEFIFLPLLAITYVIQANALTKLFLMLLWTLTLGITAIIKTKAR